MILNQMLCSRAVRTCAVAGVVLVATHAVPSAMQHNALFAETFDAHWERLRDNYPYFELYGVDWEAERAEHRPRAVAAENANEFAWELARWIAALPDPHVSFTPSLDTIAGRWSTPQLVTRFVERRPYVVGWGAEHAPAIPAAFADKSFAYPEVVAVRGEPLVGVIYVLTGGPPETSFDVTLRWPDGSETVEELQRPSEPNLPPPEKHFGENWLVTDRVGAFGYMHIRTFQPKSATLGPDGKMTTMLRAALAELRDTEGLILDLQGNGGGLVAASDPFLGHFLRRRQSYRWGNSGGKRRVIRPNTPRYRGRVVVIVDEDSASGGEWAARILRDAGRATVIGGPTVGAEAAVGESEGPDGSVVRFSEWPMVEPGVEPFQEVGIALDHVLPLTLEEVREYGWDGATDRVRRARLRKAIELLGAPADSLGRFFELASVGDSRVSGD